MIDRMEFEEHHEFVEKLRELVDGGVPARDIDVVTPVPVHEAETILKTKPSPLRFFTLAGGLTGMAAGLLFPIFTVIDWPLVTSGKPLISIPPFVIISFALTILLGSIFSFIGLLVLGRMPAIQDVVDPAETDNLFVILVRRKETA
ncbi:MAG: DUF3341 domain-containing protein [Candidatus Eisenbacteria bacterium]|nr:DUF3341 domain-containing protein [Candidatus Eisenbacteria bacterium]